MELNITVPATNKTKGSIKLAGEVFERDFNESLIHQVVNAYLAGARAGTKAQKTRSERRGGGAKPWRQKGTGRARAGTIRSPIWRKGGVTFAAKPRDFSQKVNKKMYSGAMRSIVSELIRQERLVVVESFDIKESRTAEMKKLLTGMNVNDALLLTHEFDEKVYLSARNILNIAVSTAGLVDPVSLIRHEKVLVTVDALKKLEERLQ